MTREGDSKFDVRVRERLLQSGELAESEIQRYLDGLRDVGDDAVPVVARQPALSSESDRDIVIVRTSGVRPPPVPPRLDDDLENLPIDDEEDEEDLDEDDEDDEDDEETKAEPKAELKAEPEPKAEAEAEAEDEAVTPRPAATPAAAPAAGGEADADEGPKKSDESVDEAWGDEP